MTKWIIYKATSTSGKIYVGLTSGSLEERKKKHYYSSNDNKSRKKYPFPNALRVHKFEWKIIDTAENIKEANKKEQFYIKKFNSKVPNGYNLTDGGDGSLGQKRSNIFKKECSIRMKNKFKDKNSIFYKRLIEKRVAVKRSDGVVFESYKAAAIATQCHASAIETIIKGKGKTANGFGFVPLDENRAKQQQKVYKQKDKSKNKLKKQIKDSNGVIYDSIHEASRQLNIQATSICAVLKKRIKSTHNLTFSYYKKGKK